MYHPHKYVWECVRLCGRQLLDRNTNQNQTYGRAHFEELNFHLCMYEAGSCWKQTMLTVTSFFEVGCSYTKRVQCKDESRVRTECFS